MRTVGFVWGYLPGVDVQSETARRHGLLQRFSLAFNRYPDSAPGCYDIVFDEELIVGTVQALLRLFPHDGLVAADCNADPHDGIEDAMLVDAESGEKETFGSVTLTRRNEPVCYVEHEAYQSCGGPAPYHDAFVYAFYCTEIERPTVQKALLSYSVDNDIMISDIVTGSPHPVKPSLLRRLFGRL